MEDVLAVMQNNEWSADNIDVTKKSKSGRMKLIYDGGYKTVSESNEGEDHLVEVFRNGKLLVETTFDEIRKRAL
jgi:hypothetical protein